VKVLRVLAVAGPLVFTLTWVLLGRSHPGYRPARETISSLSAHGAPGWPVMVAGQAVLVLSFLAVAVLSVRALGRAGLGPAVLYAIAAAGTVQASVFRTICTQVDAGWCTPMPRSAFPHQQWAHGIGTAMPFVTLPLACLAVAWVTWRVEGLRDVAPVALAVLVVALPSVLWFLTQGTAWHGLSEKVFLTSLGAFTGYLGFRLGGYVAEREGVGRR
jgi:hypothetical protein